MRPLMLRGRERTSRIEAPLRRAPERRDGTDGRPTLAGHAAVFDVWTEIEDWDGVYRERIMPGAFRKTLRERGVPKVMLNHGRHPSVGSLPLGVCSRALEDDTGLWIECPLSETAYNRDVVIPLLSDRALDGMSFMFDVIRETWTDDVEGGALPERTIHEVRLYEAGPVTWPAYEQTDVALRARAATLPTALTVEERAARFEAWRSEISGTATTAAPPDGDAPCVRPPTPGESPAPAATTVAHRRRRALALARYRGVPI